MNTFVPLFTVAGMKVTAYAVGITLAAAAALILLWRQCAKMKLRADTAGIAALLILPLGLLCARFFNCLVQINYYLYAWGGLEATLRLWNGGYSLWGVLGGTVLAAVIAARITWQKASALLDACAPSMALFAVLERFAEYFDDRIGYGIDVEIPFFQRLPFARQIDGFWSLAVCGLECLAALVILIVLLRKQRLAGHTIRLFFVLYCACQVFLESQRRDGFPRWLFVKVYQLAAAVVAACLVIEAVAHWALNRSNNKMKVANLIALLAGFALFVGGVVAMEFAFDGKILVTVPEWCLCLFSALCSIGIGVTAYWIIFKSGALSAGDSVKA